MIEFFEENHDEFLAGGKVYIDYFNLYPELKLEETVDYIDGISKITIGDRNQTSNGWQIEIEFMGIKFLLDTHFHGTSTLFCVEKSNAHEETIMLAFLGCFLHTIRDDWNSVN